MAYKKRQPRKYTKRPYRARRRSATNTATEGVFVLGTALLIAAGLFSYVNQSIAFDFLPDTSVLMRVLFWVMVGAFGGIAVFTLFKKIRSRVKKKKIEQEKQVMLENRYETVLVRNSFKHLTWREFEEYVGYVFERQGFDVEVTQSSNDGGLDAILRRSGSVVAVVQAKHYQQNVGRPDINKFVGAMHHKPYGYFVTTSNFTSGAIVYAETVDNLELINGRQLKQMHDALE